jgi:thioredoxin-like negative regulator of GroEL
VGAWGEKVDLAGLTPVENLFQRALRINPHNRTVLHRTGLIAMRQDDFTSAVTRLEQAFLLDPADRGVRKELGYSYAWTGQFDEAAKILESIPEASSEMDAYSRWWLEQGRPDLATNARHVWQMLTQRTGIND